MRFIGQMETNGPNLPNKIEKTAFKAEVLMI